MHIFPELSSPKEMQAVLERELQTGVVKLYQECMFPDPSSVNFYGSEGIFEGDWPSGTKVAQREAWAYKLLQQYQGFIVLFFVWFLYGDLHLFLFHALSANVGIQFKLRSEKIVGFVMEKLSGLTVEEYFALNDHRRQAKLLLV